MKPIHALAAVAAGAVGLAASALAQGPSGAEADFLRKAADVGHAEIVAGKMARAKAASGEVKTFAGQMIADHTSHGEELRRVAEAKGVSLPSELSKEQALRIKALEATVGPAFDKRYADSFGVQAHEDMLKLVRSATKVKDPAVKAYAEKTLPAVEHHLQMGKVLRSSTAKVSAPGVAAPAGLSGASGARP